MVLVTICFLTVSSGLGQSTRPGRRGNAPKAAVPVRSAATNTPVGGCSDGWDTFTVPGVNGDVRAVVSDGLGNVYIGGSFSIVNNISTTGIAKWDGTKWSALGDGIPGSVTDIAVSGTDVYAVGRFNFGRLEPIVNVAKWNGSTWTGLGPGIGGPVVNGVYTIAVSGSNVYVGGDFNEHSGNPRHVAKWDGTSWSAMGTGMDSTVHALAVGPDGSVYAGGNFTTAGGAPITAFAKWDGTSWSQVGSGVTFRVHAIAISGSNIYVGGNIDSAGGNPAFGVAKWDGTAWSALGAGTLNTDGVFNVRALTISGSDLYAGGGFTIAGGATANRIAKWDGAQWSTLGTGIGANPGSAQAVVEGIAVVGNTVIAGGYFNTAGGNPAQGLATWSSGTWSAFGGTAPLPPVDAIAASGTDVYAAGRFSFGEMSQSHGIAKWNGSTWSPVGTGVPTGSVFALAVWGDKLFAGGQLSSINPPFNGNIAMWNGTAWTPLGLGVSNAVNVITPAGDGLYVGGYFQNAGGVTANRIAKWNGTSWAGLNSGIIPTNTTVTAIVVSGGDLYVGVRYNGTDSANYFLKYDGTTWTPLGTGMTGGGVSSIAVIGTDVYVAGNFNAVGGVPASRIAKWNGSSWTALGTGIPPNPSTNYEIKLAVAGSDLIVAGDFTEAGGVPVNRIAKWDGSSWSPMGSGLNGRYGQWTVAKALISAGSDIYVGGDFFMAGCNISPFFARWRQTQWIGSSDGGDWHTPANWGNGSVPAPSTSVTIAANNASISSADVTLSSLIVTSGRTLTIGAGRTLTVTGNLDLANGNLAGPGSLVVNGDLRLNSGNITDLSSILSNGNIHLGGGNISGSGPVTLNACWTGAISGGSSTSMILSPLTRCVTPAGTYRFTVGTGSVYSPVELTNVVGNSSFTVEAKAGQHATVPGLPDNRLQRWWELTNGGITSADVTFNYSDAEVVGPEGRYRAYRIAGGAATRMPTVLDTAANRATATGVTAFSAWTLGESEPAPEILAGFVRTQRGRGAENVVVTLIDELGNTRRAVTNPLNGYYKFYNVMTFQVYRVQVLSKKHKFAVSEQMVPLEAATTNINFTALDH